MVIFGLFIADFGTHPKLFLGVIMSYPLLNEAHKSEPGSLLVLHNLQWYLSLTLPACKMTP